MKFYDPKRPTFLECVGAMFFVLVFVLLLADGIYRTQVINEERPRRLECGQRGLERKDGEKDLSNQSFAYQAAQVKESERYAKRISRTGHRPVQ